MTRAQTRQNLQEILRSIDGQGYGHYKRAKGPYQFVEEWGEFTLWIDFIQGDPFAEPSRIRVSLPQEVAKISEEFFSSEQRAIASRDFLTRAFALQAKKFSRSVGSGKSGLLEIDQPGQQILDHSSVEITKDSLEFRFFVGLPANGRRILGAFASELLCKAVPKCVEQSGLLKNLDAFSFKKHVDSAEDQAALRKALKEKNLVGFIGNGSRLPRRSGVDDRPLESEVTTFKSPESMTVTLPTPNRGNISGMGIPEGITLIVGGGYHGKSTLLQALELGVYDHVPGDGRELVVSDPNSVKIRSEDGRSVSGVTVSPFINNLPGGQDTDRFTTTNASGSTSQAASIVEALQLGCTTLMIDEDTSATNFMIRDKRMQELIKKSSEPITPFTDKVSYLRSEQGVSTIIVMGGTGEYFGLADQVIAMSSFQPEEVTKEAQKIALEHDQGRLGEGGEGFGTMLPRLGKSSSVGTARGRRDPSFKVRRTVELELGEERIDCSNLTQLVHSSQLRAIAQALVAAKRLGPHIHLDQQWSLESINPDQAGNLSGFRVFEYAAVLNRLRTFEITDNDNN